MASQTNPREERDPHDPPTKKSADKILIVGIGAGLGRVLARRLARDHEVVGVDRQRISAKLQISRSTESTRETEGSRMSFAPSYRVA